MTKMMVRLIGQSELEGRLKDTLLYFPDDVAEVMRDSLDKMVVEAKIRVRKDTHSLKKSIRRETYAQPAGCILQMGFRAGGYIVNPKTKRLVDYARDQEWGNSRGIAFTPYMRPSANKFEPEMERRLKQVGIKRFIR
ncbi:MAG: hypothetical protein ACTSPB_02520 [Candidatus Thorarchaeota archaeon]